MPSATTTVGQLMTERLETISPSDTAQEAAKKMRDKKVSSLVVTDVEDKPIGIVTERDLVRQVCTKVINSNDVIVHHIMSSPLATIDANSSVEVAADIMIQNKVRHLIVMEDEFCTSFHFKKFQWFFKVIYVFCDKKIHIFLEKCCLIDFGSRQYDLTL